MSTSGTMGHASSLRSLVVIFAGVVAANPVANVPLEGGRANTLEPVHDSWMGARTANPRDLHREYHNIFRHGNRNAASHLWTKFLLERSHQMTHETFVSMFSGFCAISGSPVGPHDYNRYKLRLDMVDGSGKVPGFFHYCCWPCVCDTQDWIRVDTRIVQLADGYRRRYRFAVIGNPCDRPEALTTQFHDPFGRGSHSLQQVAPEVVCNGRGVLQGAPLSDHGYVIIGMFFDYPSEADEATAMTLQASMAPQPGRIKEVNGVKYQDEFEFGPMCEDRKNNGYNSGMGEIFRKVAEISPIVIPKLPLINGPTPAPTVEAGEPVRQIGQCDEGFYEDGRCAATRSRLDEL